MKIIKFITFLMVLAGSSVSCNKNNNTNMLPNIDDLYAQPLPVIQKCVQGKWKWYVSIGGLAGYNYSDNTFVDINEDTFVIKYYDGSQQTFHYTWERQNATLIEHETYMMWNVERNEAGWYFISIKNDTLNVAINLPPGSVDIPYSFGFVRIK